MPRPPLSPLFHLHFGHRSLDDYNPIQLPIRGIAPDPAQSYTPILVRHFHISSRSAAKQ